MPAATSMDIPLAKFGTYNINWIGTNLGSISSTNASISDYNGTSITLYYLSSAASFSSATESQIVSMVQAHYNNEIDLSTIWSVGDSRSITLSHMSSAGTYSGGTFKVGEAHAAQTQEFVILDFNHDDLVTSINGHNKAAVSIGMKDCLNETGYIDSDTNLNNWSKSSRYKWCNSIFYNSLPNNWRNIIKQVSKQYNTTSNMPAYANHYTWLLSLYESNDNENHYEYYKTASNRIKKVNGSNSAWWTRWIYYYNGYFFYYHPQNSWSYTGPQVAFGISPGFCI